MNNKKILPILVAAIVLVLTMSISNDPKMALVTTLFSMLVSYAIGLFLKPAAPDDLQQSSHVRDAEHAYQKTVDELINFYGEPDDIVLLNPTRGNEAQGVILAYSQQGFIVVDGEKMPIADIDDVTFNNAAVAYTPNSYQLIVTPKNKKQPLHHLPLGNDGDWALQATEQLRQYLNR